MFVFCLGWLELLAKPQYFPSFGTQKLFQRMSGIQGATLLMTPAMLPLGLT